MWWCLANRFSVIYCFEAKIWSLIHYALPTLYVANSQGYLGILNLVKSLLSLFKLPSYIYLYQCISFCLPLMSEVCSALFSFHNSHQNSSGTEQVSAGAHVGLGTAVRTMMSLPFTCNWRSQRSVSTVVLIKHKHLPTVSGTWHFSDKSMCADSVCCTHTHSLRFLGSVKPCSYAAQALKTNIFGLHWTYWTLMDLLYCAGIVPLVFPGSTELWVSEMVGIFRCNRGMIHLFPLNAAQ